MFVHPPTSNAQKPSTAQKARDLLAGKLKLEVSVGPHLTVFGNFLLCSCVNIFTSFFIICFFSKVGFGEDTLDKLRCSDYAWVGAMALSGICLLVIYLLDFFWPPHHPGELLVIPNNCPVVLVPCIIVFFVSFLAGCFLLVVYYSWVPILALIFSNPVLWSAIQFFMKPKIDFELSTADADAHAAVLYQARFEERIRLNKKFWQGCFYSQILASVALMIYWIVWLAVSDGGSLTSSTDFEKEVVFDDIMLWSSPLITSISFAMFSAMSYLHVSLSRQEKNKFEETRPSAPPLKKQSTLQFNRQTSVKEYDISGLKEKAASDLDFVIKLLFASLVGLLSINWLVYILTLRNPFVLMVQWYFALLGVALIYTLLTSFQRLLTIMWDSVMQHIMVRGAMSAANSNVGRALFWLIFGPGVPFIVLLSWVNQEVRRKRQLGTVDNSQGFWRTHMTDRVYRFFSFVLDCNYVRVMTVICICAVAAIIFNLTPLSLTIFLVYMKKVLSSFNFGLLLLLVFIVGITMFLLPPVPGAPIYLFGGTLIAQKGDELWGTKGFWIGLVVNIVLSLFMKLTASAIQQGIIGRFLGNVAWVKQTIGCHKPFMKAVEKILRTPGWSVGKVAILVGGPDWPTSVLAGVLGLSVIPIAFGTIPIIFYIIPLGASGSLYLKQDDSEIFAALAEASFALTALMTVAIYAAIWWVVQQVLIEHEEELQRMSKEHIHLYWLDHVTEKSKVATKIPWQSVPTVWKGVFLAAVFILVALAQAYFWIQGRLFGTVEITDDIDEIKWYGIKENDDDPVLTSYGVASLAVCGVGILLWIVFAIWKWLQVREVVAATMEKLQASEQEWKAAELDKMCPEIDSE